LAADRFFAISLIATIFLIATYPVWQLVAAVKGKKWVTCPLACLLNTS
jgi:hypothetical protein